MSAPNVSKMIITSKDQMHSEWAGFKTTGMAVALNVCPYSIGGSKDFPIAVLLSVGQGVCEWETCLKEAFDVAIERTKYISTSEVVIGGDGQVILYPPRQQILPDETASTTAPSTPSLSLSEKVAVPPEEAFMTGVEQSSNYLMDHLKRMVENALINGNTKILYLTLSSAALIRGQLNVYKEAFKMPTTDSFTKTIKRCNELVELMTSHILNYHCDLLKSGFIHDPDSIDWKNPKKYEEGERFSVALQVFSFHIQNLRNDLWQYTTPKIGESILASIFTDLLSTLVTRYAQLEPSDVRLPVYRADIVVLLTITASILPSLISSPHHLFNVQLHESAAFPIHRRANLLIKVAAVKAAPIEIIARVFGKGINLKKKKTENRGKEPVHIGRTSEWLRFLNPTYYPRGVQSMAQLPDNVYVYHCLHTAASRPQPDYQLILRGLLSKKYLGAKTLIKGLQEAPGYVHGDKSCGGPLCLPHLCTPPVIPHTVYAGVVQVLFQCIPSVKILSDIMYPGIKASGLWDSLDRKQVWNMQRPPWHHALVQLIGHHIAGVVAEVVRSVPSEPPGKPAHPSQQSVRLEHHLSAWTMQMLTGVESIADMIPTPLIHVANSINSVIPPTVKPVGGHVVAQLVACALYSMVNSRSTVNQFGEGGPISDSQWDMMVAVGERLCSLHEGSYESHLQQLTKALLNQIRKEPQGSDEELEDLDEYTDEDVIHSVFTGLSDQMLSNSQGQHALGVIYEFLKQNMDWVREALGLPTIIPPSVDAPTVPPVAMSFLPKPKTYNPLYCFDKIFYTPYNQEHIMNFDGDWETILRGDLWLPKVTVINMLKQRPEFKEDAILTDEEQAAVTKLKPHIKTDDELLEQNN